MLLPSQLLDSWKLENCSWIDVGLPAVGPVAVPAGARAAIIGTYGDAAAAVAKVKKVIY